MELIISPTRSIFKGFNCTHGVDIVNSHSSSYDSHKIHYLNTSTDDMNCDSSTTCSNSYSNSSNNRNSRSNTFTSCNRHNSIYTVHSTDNNDIESCRFLHYLPTEIVILILSEYLTTKELCCFDNSITNHVNRELFLSIIADKLFVTKGTKQLGDKIFSYFHWLAKRQVKTTTIDLNYVRSNRLNDCSRQRNSNRTTMFEAIYNKILGKPHDNNHNSVSNKITNKDNFKVLMEALEKINYTKVNIITCINSIIHQELLILLISKTTTLRLLDMSNCIFLLGAGRYSFQDMNKAVVTLSKHFNHIQSINFSGTRLNDYGMEVITRNMKIDNNTPTSNQRLSISDTDTTSNKLNMKGINLSNCSVSSVSLVKFIHDCSDLRSINLSQCDRVTDEVILAISNKCKNLLFLDISMCRRISDQNCLIQLIKSCKSIVHLDISWCDWVNDDVLRAIAENLPSLSYLNISYCTNLTDNGVAVLLNDTNSNSTNKYVESKANNNIANILNLNLKEIRLDGKSMKLTATSIDIIARKCPNLKSLLMQHSSQLTFNSIINLVEKCEKLQKVYIAGSNIASEINEWNYTQTISQNTHDDVNYANESDINGNSNRVISVDNSKFSQLPWNRFSEKISLLSYDTI